MLQRVMNIIAVILNSELVVSKMIENVKIVIYFT